MSIPSLTIASTSTSPRDAIGAAPKAKGPDDEFRTAFRDFTAGTIFKQMLKSLRKMHDEPAYLSGGEAEKTFRKMMDEKVAEQMTESHGAAISDPMFETFNARIPVEDIVPGFGGPPNAEAGGDDGSEVATIVDAVA